jgi:hypothetical protein
MNTNGTKYDLLETLFSRMPEEALPGNFQAEMMQRIRKEAVRIRKRNQLLNLSALIAASLAIIGLAVAALIRIGIPQYHFDFQSITIPPFYLCLGALSLILLLGDYLFRQAYYKRHPEI